MSDAARSVLSDPRAPEGEVFDARSELEHQHRPTAATDLPGSDVIGAVAKAIRSGEIHDTPLGKAMHGGLGGGHPRPGRGDAKAGMRSVRVDPMQVQAVGDSYTEKPGAIDFQGLREMVGASPILSAIVATRIRQITRFCAPSEDGGPGFVIRHVDHEHEPSDAEKEQMKLLQRFFTNCGWEFKPRERKRLRRDPFPTFVAKLVRDSLTFDASPIETEQKRKRQSGIDGLYALDGASIRLCTEEGYSGDDEVFAVQVVSGRIATTYDLDQLIYEVRNPRTDLHLNGYGLGEAELLVRTVTYLLNATTYNADYFDKNSLPPGMLQVFGDYSDEDVASFRRHWGQMIRGVGNRWALPVLASKDKESGAVFTPFSEPATEMAFGKWITFLTSVACAIYSIDPAEIGFESFAAAKSTLSGEDTSEKLAASRDKGFRPLCAHFEAILSDFVVADFNPDFCFRFAGMEEEDKERAWEAKKLVLTVDEVRAEEGYTPYPDPSVGALPVNPQLMQAAMQAAGMGQDPAGGDGGDADFGAGPPEEGEPGDDFGAEQGAPQEEPGDDFGSERPEEKPPGDDFGGEQAGDTGGKPKAKGQAAAKGRPGQPVRKAYGLALSRSALWRLGLR
jgi:Phage portal protein